MTVATQTNTQHRFPTTEVESREWTYTDKSEWGRGAWSDEPDKVQWTDPETGLPCLVVRGGSGALCGYAGVPKSHPWFGKQYRDCVLPEAKPRGEDPTDRMFSADPSSFYQTHMAAQLECGEGWCSHAPAYKLDAHGGITFSGACSPHADNPERGICHVVLGDEQVWWFGFDCAQSGDLTPESDARRPEYASGGSYHNLWSVKRGATNIARQLNSPETAGVDDDDE